MTIAAGFVHKDGVILCADTELTAGDKKLQGSKLFHFDCPSGRFAFVFAGHLYNAVSTLQKIRTRLSTVKRNGLEEVEAVLDREYRRLVISQPDYLHHSLDFAFIFAFQPLRSHVLMYVTDRVSIREEKWTAAIGIGGVFAEQLIDAARVGIVARGDFLTLGAYVLGSVKKRITNCGGASLFIDLSHDGSHINFYGDDYLKAIEEWFGVYQMLALGLFAALGNARMSEEDFIRNLEKFGGDMVEQRRKWKDLKARHIEVSKAYQIISRSKAKSVRRATKRGR